MHPSGFTVGVAGEIVGGGGGVPAGGGVTGPPTRSNTTITSTSSSGMTTVQVVGVASPQPVQLVTQEPASACAERTIFVAGLSAAEQELRQSMLAESLTTRPDPEPRNETKRMHGPPHARSRDRLDTTEARPTSEPAADEATTPAVMLHASSTASAIGRLSRSPEREVLDCSHTERE